MGTLPTSSGLRGRGRPSVYRRSQSRVGLTGGIHELTRPLSLVCDVAVETPVIWTDYGDHAHFVQHDGVSNTGTGEPTPRSASESRLTVDQLTEALELQPQLCEPPIGVRIALQYWLKSKERRTDVPDGLVFLRTALEALFLDRSNRSELAFRLALQGAWYTGRNPVERQDRFDVLKKGLSCHAGSTGIFSLLVVKARAKRRRFVRDSWIPAHQGNDMTDTKAVIPAQTGIHELGSAYAGSVASLQPSVRAQLCPEYGVNSRPSTASARATSNFFFAAGAPTRWNTS